MNKIIIVAAIILLSSFNSAQNNHFYRNNKIAKNSIHKFKVEALDGSAIDFSKYKGRKILVVNTASECGYTPQYELLEKLYDKYNDKLVIVGFPANNFGGQEPGSNLEIQEFCKKNYGVTFPMAAKVSVKGDDIAPVFKWLTTKKLNGKMDAEIKWNFTKFLLDEQGVLIAKFDSKVSPMDDEILSYLK
ncbi:MAG: glutathione peroxidase [Chitinophagaceae bacterium]|nr:glutathione peroxidase [Chitinophagaceae bacterium]